MKKERTFFKLKINLPDLDQFVKNSDPCTAIYDAELVIDTDDLILKIFFNSKEYLGDKVGYWLSNNREDRLLNYFEVTEIIQPKDLLAVDFLEYDYSEISKNTAYQEFGKQYFTLKLDGIRKKFEHIDEKTTRFYFTKSGFPQVEMNYHYHQNFWDYEAYKWEPHNNVIDFIKFNNIEFKPEHEFYHTKDGSPSITIHKDPIIAIKHEGLNDEEEIKKQFSLLLSLFSFYASENLDYSASHIHTSEYYYFEKKDVSNEPARGDGHGMFRWEFLNALNLITSVDAAKLLTNAEFVQNIISRFNYALQLHGESKFMIMYNILEQIRTQYVLEGKIEQDKAGNPPKLNKVKQEYEFVVENKENAEGLIKEALEKVAEFIKEEQKEDFKKEISHKADGIMLMSMANQFKSLFDYLNIDPSNHDLDFNKIKNIRNAIFHGNPVGKNAGYMQFANHPNKLPRFVGTVILKYFGIDDLSKVDKKFKAR